MTPTTVRTPAELTVIATCPTCEQTTGIRMSIGAELLVSDEGSELRLKGRSKGVAHICDQIPMGFDQDADVGHQVTEAIATAAVLTSSGAVDPETGEILGRSSVEELAARVEQLPANEQLAVHAAVKGLRGLRDMAERTGTSVTVSALGQSATFGPPAAEDDDGEDILFRIVRSGETLDEALRRIEKLDDYNRIIGTAAGQSLLEALKEEGAGSRVPFPADPS